uniref:F-box/LRR-repeat protein 17 n=1 Tax=Lygus hesperus TaxID=30085 RepID=A0A0A9WEC7_LYGHE
MAAQTEEINNVDQPDSDPVQFNNLLKTVWGIFENQICEDVEALAMFKSAAASIANNQTFKKIEEEFKLGALGEYVVGDQEALPFLTTVMSHIHHKIDDYNTPHPACQNNPKKMTHTMTRFWEELELKMGASDETRSIVDEISEKVSRVADNLVVENPAFAQSLSEIGVCIKESWTNMKNDVERCIHRARKRKYKIESMEKIYSRMICKGLDAARTIQQKIESIKIRHGI